MKSSRNTSTSGKLASGRRTPARKTKAKKKTTRTMPVWMRNTLALIVYAKMIMPILMAGSRPKNTNGTCSTQQSSAIKHPTPSLNFQLSQRRVANASRKNISESVSTTV